MIGITDKVEYIAAAMINEPSPADIRFVLRHCETCGEDFRPYTADTRFCSRECFGRRPKKDTLVERFWAYTDRRGDDECWPWKRPCSGFGYGRIWRTGRTEGAHRISWEIHNGSIPDGLEVLHRCDNPPCVNPAHLFIGTKTDNTQDKVSKQRHARGESHGNSKITVAQVAAIRADTRTTKVIAAEYGIHFSNVSLIKRGLAWK